MLDEVVIELGSALLFFLSVICASSPDGGVGADTYAFPSNTASPWDNGGLSCWPDEPKVAVELPIQECRQTFSEYFGSSISKGDNN